MSILITGGAGYIGSVLVPLLLSKGCRVTVLDNFMFNQSSLLECCSNPNFDIINADSRNENAVREAMKGKDYIIPLAALAGFPICDKEACSAYSINLDAIKMILRLREKGQRIIFPCTNSGYGLGEGENFCTENSPIKPISIYGKSKVEAEAAVLRERMGEEPVILLDDVLSELDSGRRNYLLSNLSGKQVIMTSCEKKDINAEKVIGVRNGEFCEI